MIKNEAPRNKLRGIKAKFFRSQPSFALRATEGFSPPSASQFTASMKAKENNNWLLITLLAITLIILGVIMPTIFWLSQNFNFTKKLHTTITNYYATEQTYAKILTDYKNHSTSQQSLNKMLATEQTLLELDKQLNILAKKNQLDLQYNWGEIKTATLSYKNLKISTSGNAGDILNFVNALENLPTYISIQNLEMQTDYPLTSGFILTEVYLKI